MLERLVLAVPSAAQDRAVARFDAGDVGAFVEVLVLKVIFDVLAIVIEVTKFD